MLNVLPPQRKITLRRTYWLQQLNILVGMAVIATSLAVVMMLTSDWILQRWLNSNTVATKADFISAEERTELKNLISALTIAVNQAQPLLNQTNQPLTDLQSLLEPTPETISLHSFSLNYTEQAVRITGTAESRDDLIAYQQQLTNISGISNVKLPLSDLNQRESIPFTITASYATTSL